MSLTKHIHLRRSLILIAALFFTVACSKKTTEQSTPVQQTPAVPAPFAKGADISWVSQMEAANIPFSNTSGTQQNLFTILKDLNLNTIRLRVWVNPSSGWNNKSDVVAKAVRAKNAGMRVLIDFHFSDTWADPANQTKPAAWAGQDLNALKASVSAHVTDVLTALSNAGVAPEWVQVGNETNDGMLWPEGRASTNMNSFAQLVNAGYSAVKSVMPSCKVIVHLSNGWDNSLFRWMFDGLRNNGANFDVIGMSLYPTSTNWAGLNNQCLANMNDMVARYGKEVMIVEVGMSWDQPAASKAFIADLVSKVKLISNNKGLGVLYWEPEAYNNWQGYPLGAFDNTGKPTEALTGFSQ